MKISLIYFMIILVIFSGCGKIKVADSNHNVNVAIPNTQHRVDVVMQMDFAAIDAFFETLCQQKFSGISITPELQTDIDKCVGDNKMEFIKHFAPITGAATGGK